jgi:uncharacterized protein (TIGR03437 family)
VKFATRSTTSSGERRQTGIPIDPVLFIVTFNGVAIITANGPFYSPGIADRACRPGLVRFVEPDGSKMAAAINQDGTINSQTHPAPAGSVVTLWATGLGQTNPPGVDGQMQTNIAAKYLADVQVTIGGAPTAEQYAGPAPSFARLSQINLQIPQTKSGAQPVQLPIGTAPFPQNVQLWVQ